MLLTSISILTLACVYAFWIRPLLKTRPALAHFWDREASFIAAVRLKFAGLKERLTAALVTAAGGIVFMHDQIVQLLPGLDTAPIAAQVPAWLWSLMPVAVALAMLFFRNLAERRLAAG